MSVTMNENAITLRFTGRAAAYQAFGELTHLGSAAEVHGAVLVERLEGGAVRVSETLGAVPGRNTGGDGLVGSLVGLLDGPLGMLVGWGVGAMIGGGHDRSRAAGTTRPVSEVTAAGSFAPHLSPGGGAVILAEAGESDTDALNLLAMRYDAVLERRPAGAVRAELKVMEEEAEQIRKRVAKAGRRRRRAEVARRVDRRPGVREGGGAASRRLLAA
ncbi:hypothetical protein F9278_41320 [Streptomyces phaeolivaceus]|uniref:DUF1269 domain-containing protein n=1 Tax=Streptomyces phaeolivaceus TaxID=2653200 RepID=A0A5P8KFM1_9ACTN|nr:hypothetical protein [Streptomyces phaeolivaceus]QFR01559.1 hypothetical protein F9278_41320 [Streptomyces phaeolivaceus]